MKKSDDDLVFEKMDRIIDLLKHLLALELARGGVKQTVIAKHLGVANATVGKLLQGVKRAAD